MSVAEDAIAGAPPLIIDAIEQRRYVLPLDPPFNASWDPAPRTRFVSDVIVVRSGGLEGVGAGDAMAGFAGHEDLFIGRDAREIERHVRVLENLAFHYGRMMPLEVALWDLAGKATGQPLWRMLGAASGDVPVYASTGERMSVAARAESARAILDRGFAAMKIRFHEQDIAAGVRAVREAVGDSLAILVDANQGWRMPWDAAPPWTLDQARTVARGLAELDVYWLEEPLDRHDYAGMRALRDDGLVRIAGGEGARDIGELRSLLAAGSLDVYQPDVAWSTGVLRATQFAAEARAAGAMYTPHTWNDGIVLRANLHVAAACANAPFVEYPFDPPRWAPERRDFLLPQPTLAEGGVVRLGEAPGLGVEIDWKAAERWRVQ